MNDPLDRDKFPNRPDHPDFWKLCKILLDHDAQAIEDNRPIPEIVTSLIDPDTLDYVAMNRTGIAIQTMGLPSMIHPALAAVWLDAFVAGIRFAKATS